MYATTLIDGFKTEETLRLPTDGEATLLQVIAPETGSEAPTVQLNLGYRAPLSFVPYYEAGGRNDGTWRLTWMQLAPA